MATKLHFWDAGDLTVGIGSNQAEIALELDGASEEQTAENIAHAKLVLCKALGEIWDNGRVHCMTNAELHAGEEAAPENRINEACSDCGAVHAPKQNTLCDR